MIASYQITISGSSAAAVNLGLDSDEDYRHKKWYKRLQPDKYQGSFLVAQDDALDFAVQNSTQKGHPEIAAPGQISVPNYQVDPGNKDLGSRSREPRNAGADVSARVKIIVGPAHESLAKLKPDPPPFDLTFIDADTSHFTTYYTEAKRLFRSGGVIGGGVSNPTNTEFINVKIRELLQFLKDDTEVEATTIGTVGVKGYDGFSYIVKK
ncbi:hypothetical protein PQX77_013389 [Marasmius sp. AFHP31]|nr:hypothetical protein PQX77_013389 [Marasmius sp. AFHP31]